MNLEEGPIGLKRPWIIIIITVLLVSVILVVGNQTYKATEETTFDEFNQKQLVLAEGVTTGIELYFETLAAELKAVGRFPEIQRLEEAPSRKVLQSRFEELESIGVNDIGVLDANGVLKYNAAAAQIEGIDFSWREYFQEAKKMTPDDDTYIIEFIEFKGVEAGQKGVLTAMPMFDASTGNFAGVVVITLKLDTITQRFVAHVKSSERGHAFLIDDEYNVLWAPDPSLFGKNLLEESEGFPEFQQVVKHLADAVSGKAEYSYYKFDESKGRYTEETEEKLLAHEHIRLGKEIWSLGVWAPKEEARKLIRDAYLRLLLLVGLAILIILIGSFYALTVSSRISRTLGREVETKTGALKESEEKYRILIESSSDCICHIDLEGKILYINPGGVRRNELDNLNDVLDGDCTYGICEDHKGLMEDAMERARNGMTTGLEYQSTNSKGKELWWESIVGPIKDDKGEVVSMIMVSHDITERKVAEEALRESEEKYRHLFEDSIEGISISKGDRVISANKALLDIFGYRSLEEFGKVSILDHVAPESRRMAKEMMKKREKGESQSPRGEYKIVRKEGEIRDIEVSTVEVIIGNEKYVQTTLRDITERKRLEEELKDRVKELEQSNRLKDVFTDILRHDLLNPIGVIQNIVEMMRDWKHTSEEISELNMIQRNVNKLHIMVDNATKYAKLESVDKLDFEKADLSEIIGKTIKRVEDLAKEKDMEIVNRMNGEHFASVNPFIEDVFINVLTNALKYGPEKSKVIVDIYVNEREWRITVTDFGDGIPDEHKEAVFDRFKRIKKGPVKGTGLGLAIARRIVTLHNGKLWVEDNPDGGSIFCINIPKA